MDRPVMSSNKLFQNDRRGDSFCPWVFYEEQTLPPRFALVGGCNELICTTLSSIEL